MPREKIYTKAGDDGTTGLFYGGRVPKDSALPAAYGTVDEAQAVLGMARAEAGHGSELEPLLVAIMRDLYVLMAELATAPENRSKLTPAVTAMTPEMVAALETLIDAYTERFSPPTEFVVPGQTKVAALLDVARTVVRRAERLTPRRRAVARGLGLPEPVVRPLVDPRPLARGHPPQRPHLTHGSHRAAHLHHRPQRTA